MDQSRHRARGRADRCGPGNPAAAETSPLSTGANDDRSAGAAFEQADTAQDQRPHDPLAEIGLLHHQIAQPLRGDDERLHRLDRLRVDQRGAGRKLRQFADEAARLVGNDYLAPAEATLRNVHLARQDDDQARRHVAGFDDDARPRRRNWPARNGACARCRPHQAWETSDRGGP